MCKIFKSGIVCGICRRSIYELCYLALHHIIGIDRNTAGRLTCTVFESHQRIRWIRWIAHLKRRKSYIFGTVHYKCNKCSVNIGVIRARNRTAFRSGVALESCQHLLVDRFLRRREQLIKIICIIAEITAKLYGNFRLRRCCIYLIGIYRLGNILQQDIICTCLKYRLHSRIKLIGCFSQRTDRQAYCRHCCRKCNCKNRT